LSRHLGTALLTAHAPFGALLHLLVIGAQRGTIVGAAPTHFRAGSAGFMVQFRAAYQEVSADLTNLRAVGQWANMLFLGMFAAHAQAILHRLQAHPVTVDTVFDAIFNFVIDPFLLFNHRACPFRRGIPYERSNFGLRIESLSMSNARAKNSWPKLSAVAGIQN
ncbi:MAG: hypothetical protein ACXWX7_18590, partial [Candidatus Binatia bacterium]